MTPPEHRDTPDLLRRMFTLRNGVLLFLVFCLVATTISVGITAVLALVLGSGLQTQMGVIGQIFESVNAAFSGLAFIALVVTFRLQHDELKLQRAELQNQHQAMDKSQGALRRSAEADIRALHMQLIKMSMDDEDLAAVWPQYLGPISPVPSKQNKYANLIIQHHRMLHEYGLYDSDDIKGAVRYLFTSPIIRSYWQGRMAPRRLMNVGKAAELEFDQIVDSVYRETGPAGTPPREEGAEIIDLDTRREAEPESGAR